MATGHHVTRKTDAVRRSVRPEVLIGPSYFAACTHGSRSHHIDRISVTAPGSLFIRVQPTTGQGTQHTWYPAGNAQTEHSLGHALQLLRRYVDAGHCTADHPIAAI